MNDLLFVINDSMKNDVYVSGFVRNFKRKSLKMMDFDMEAKGCENEFLRETISFVNMIDFCLK